MQHIFKQHDTTRHPIQCYLPTIQHNGRGIKKFYQTSFQCLAKMTQAHNTVQEYTGTLVENAISQALTKVKDAVTPSSTTVDASIQGINNTNPSYQSNWTSTWPTSNPTMSHTPHIDTHPTYRHQEACTNPQTNVIRQYLYQTPSDFNQLVVEFFRHQMELAHSTQCLHQQTTGALHNIAKSSSLQENLHFINEIPMFKAIDLNHLMNV